MAVGVSSSRRRRDKCASTAQSGRTRHGRPHAELLERRLLLADVSWLSDADGLWSDGANWSTGSPPEIGDNVIISRPGVTVAVVLDIPFYEFNSGGSLLLNEVLFVAPGSTLEWSGGTWSGAGTVAIDDGAFLQISGSDEKVMRDGIILFNGGTVAWTGSGNIRGAVGATIRNFGLFDIQTDADLTFPSGVGTGVFKNFDRVIKSDSPDPNDGRTIIGGDQGFTFDNSGVTSVFAGTLALGDDQNVGVATGDFEIGVGATLEFLRGEYLVIPIREPNPDIIPLISGGGRVLVSGGIVKLFAEYAVHETVVTGGEMRLHQNMAEILGEEQSFTDPRTPSALTNILTVSGGIFGGNGAGVQVPNPYPFLEVAPPLPPPSLEHPTIIVNDSFTWTGGALDGRGRIVIGEFAAGAISGSGDRPVSASFILDVFGRLDWFDDNTITLSTASRIWVHRTGIFQAHNDSSILADDGEGFIDNMGHFVKAGGTGITVIGEGIHFLNDTLLFPIEEPYQVVYEPINFPFLDSRVEIETGTLQFLGDSTNLDVILVKEGAILNFAGGIHANLRDVRDATRRGSILGLGTVEFGDSIFEDVGLYDIQTTIFGTGVYNFRNPAEGSGVSQTTVLNGGTIGGEGAYKISGPDGSGGTFEWNNGVFDGPGTLIVAPAATLTIPDGDRQMTNGYSLDNRGTVDWAGSSGVLSIDGNFTQTSTGNLVLGLNSPTDFDRLVVGGSVTLAGTLTLEPTFEPGSEDTFILIDNAGTDAVVGEFQGLPQGTIVTLGSQQFVITYVGGDGNDVALVALGPEPLITIDDPIVVEGDNGTVDLIFTITLSNVSLQTVTVDFATSDGTATAGSDYNAASGTISIPANTLTHTFIVTVLSDLVEESDETLFFTLSNPTNASLLDAQGIGTIVDDDAPPRVGFATATYTVIENEPVAVITLIRSGVAGAVTVKYATSNGSALAGTDYAGVSGTVAFAADQTQAIFTIPIIDDNLSEGPETVNLTLSDVQGGTLGLSSAVLTIQDNEPLPSITITDASGPEENGPFIFTVSFSTLSAQTITVNFTTTNSTALAGSDFVATSGTLTFAPGETSKTIQVNLIDDAVGEALERFFVDLSGAANATIGDSRGVGTILNDAGFFAFSSANFSGNENGAIATITVLRNGGSDGAASVNFGTADGTATAGDDYTTSSGTLNFASGQTSATFQVAILQDRIHDPDETVVLSLSSPSAPATLGAQATATLRISDDDDAAGTVVVADRFRGGINIRILDAASFTTRSTFLAYTGRTPGDVRIATGDVTGDGVPDIITALSKGGSSVRVFDGATGTHHATFQAFGPRDSGIFVAAGDVNGDGRDDVIVSHGLSRLVRVFDGLSGNLIDSPAQVLVSFDVPYRDGVSVASGDVNADGFDDVIVGAGTRSSALRVFSGADGSLLHSFSSHDASVRSGIHVAAGDIDNDGDADLIASPRRNGKTLVRVFDGADGTLLSSFSAFRNFSGAMSIGTVNGNGDGRDDVIVMRSGSRRQEFRVFDTPQENQFMSFSVVSASKTPPLFFAGTL